MTGQNKLEMVVDGPYTPGDVFNLQMWVPKKESEAVRPIQEPHVDWPYAPGDMVDIQPKVK